MHQKLPKRAKIVTTGHKNRLKHLTDTVQGLLHVKQTTRYIYTHSTVNYTQISVFVKIGNEKFRILVKKIDFFRKGYDPQLK